MTYPNFKGLHMMNIERIIETDSNIRKKIITKLEKRLDEKITYADYQLTNPLFIRDMKNIITKSLQNLKIGEEIRMNSYANQEKAYSLTKEGSIGTVTELKGENKINVNFYYQTGATPPHKSDIWKVKKSCAYKLKFYGIISESGSYEKAAEQILNQIILSQKVYLSELNKCGKVLIKKLLEEEKIFLFNDEKSLRKTKKKAILYEDVHLEGTKKYLRGTGSAKLIWNYDDEKGLISLLGSDIEKTRQDDYTDYGLAKLDQVEYSQTMAELSIIEKAKQVNANYILIKQKQVISSSQDETIISIIEGLPMRIIGDKEMEYLLSIPNLEDNIVKALTEVPFFEDWTKTYPMILARCYPQKFIEHFPNIGVEEKKDILKCLIDVEYDNKEVIAWLNENEKELITEVGLNLI